MATVLPVNLSVEEAIELDKWRRIEIARRAAKRKDILTWGAALFPDKFSLPFCLPLHSYFVSIRHLPRTNSKAPRYHSKTTVRCFLIPIFQALEEPGTFNHYLNVQATDTKADAVNLTIRTELEENEMLFQLYGDVTTSRWSVRQFVLSNGVCMTAVGAGQSIRGIHYRNRRPDYLCVDDLYDEEDIYSPEATEKKNSWFWSTLYPARAQGRMNCVHVQGTATNEMDILNKLEKSTDFVSRTFKAIPRYGQSEEVLWPEKNTYQDLMRDMGLMTTTIFMREMQNEPRDDSASIIKRAWIQEYDPADLVPHGVFEYVGCFLGCDPSIGEKEENDFTGIVLYYVFRYTDGRGFFYYIAAIWNEHLSLHKRVELLQHIQDLQPDNRKIVKAFIEGVAGFKDFVAEVRRKTTIPVQEIPEPGKRVPDKLAHLESKGWFFENGRVFLNKNIDPKLKDAFIYQMCTNHPQYDDIRDATLMPLEMPRKEALAYMD